MKPFNSNNGKAVLPGLLIGSFLPVLCNLSCGEVSAAEQSTVISPTNGPTATTTSVSTTSTTPGGPGVHSDDERAIREQADQFAQAFSKAQAEPIAAMCTDDCTLTDSDGMKFVGRDEILKLYERSFRENGANQASVHIESLTFPAPGVCIEDGTLFISKMNDETRYTVVHLKRNGTWKMFRITESPYNPEPAEALKELGWMLGNWTLKHKDSAVTLVVHPIAHGNFLSMRFSDKPENAFDCEELQLVGWSFKTKDIVSWHFSDDGTFGFGHWLRNGSNWFIDTTGVRPDGAVTAARYKIDRIDNDHFRWQAVSRVSGGEKLLDLPPVDVVRNK
jgi:uncharacterized protein (TIGR02246 family)